VIAVLPVVPTLKDFSDSLYKCEYATFFKALGALSPLPLA
jgi:26S proteasome regulatory subunit N7